jgi:hypothetical protein
MQPWPFIDWWLLVLLVVAPLAVALIPTVMAALWERRLVWPYVPLAERGERRQLDASITANPAALRRPPAEESVLVPTEEAARANAAAEDLGFEPLGAFRDGKGHIYRIRYDFWLGPDHEILALISSGTLMHIPVRSIWLFTRLADGRCLTTVNSQTASEFDMAGMTLEAVLPGVSFDMLVAHHRGRIETAPAPAVPYAHDHPLRDHLEFRWRRIDRLEERGLVWFLDGEQSAWRYTFKGALILAVRAHLQALRRIFWPDACAGFFRGRGRD